MMQFTVAIQPDDYGPGDAASPRWTRLLQEAGHAVRTVNVYRADVLQQLHGCDGFMWRHAHIPHLRQIARRLLPVAEGVLGLMVYPDQPTCWHYDDKIAQSYLFHAKGIPTPKTWVWFDKQLAKDWAAEARYPLVLKLWSGASSENVRLVSSLDEAVLWIDRLFGRGIYGLSDSSAEPWRWGRRRIRAVAKLLLKGMPPNEIADEDVWELHKNYVLFQEFLPGNSFDTRITVIGKRAFGFRRFNRDNDFRASGSGKIDWNPETVDPRFIRLAFYIAKAIGSQSCAIDGLYRGNEVVVSEISYTYVSWAVQGCPGHWELSGDPSSGDLIWRVGKMWPEEAQVADFLERLETHKGQVHR
jgi:hypothetical protein